MKKDKNLRECIGTIVVEEHCWWSWSFLIGDDIQNMENYFDQFLLGNEQEGSIKDT